MVYTYISALEGLKMWPGNVANLLAVKLFNWNFHSLELCLADAIHNFKWVKIIQIWKKGGQLFSNLADLCHILSLTFWNVVLHVLIKKLKSWIYLGPAVKGLIIHSRCYRRYWERL